MTSNGVNGTVFDVLCQTTSTDSERIALLARFPSLLTEHEKMQSQLKCNFAYFGFLQQELPYFYVLRQNVTTVL